MNTSRNYEQFDVLLAEFPFSDFTGAKVRPVLVLATPGGENVITCKISTQKRPQNPYEIQLPIRTVPGAHLDNSFTHTDTIFTLHESRIRKKIGTVQPEHHNVIRNILAKLFSL